jgi:hypothetical protein
MFYADRTVFYGVKQCLTGKNNVKSQERSKKATRPPMMGFPIQQLKDWVGAGSTL